MIVLNWWTIPAVLEGLLVVLCVGFGSNRDLPFASVAAAAWFVIGSLVCAAMAGAFYVAARV